MEADYVPLARAAALVYSRLFPDESVKDAKRLDLLGVAISAQIRLYQRDMKTGAVTPVEEQELARGRFTRGASRLEFPDREPLRSLVVARRELYPAIDAIAKDPTCPILRLCRRPRPAHCSSARGA